jgi:hypothetical protein
MYYQGKNGQLRCYAQIRVDLQQFIFYFGLDYSDGEVRFKNSLDFEGEALTFSLIRRIIYPAVQTMSNYLPGMMKVAFGARTPVEAIQEIEG